MGKYINNGPNGDILPLQGKAQALIANGATPIHTPVTWTDDLVCVIDNGMFEAAGYAYDENEMRVFKSPDGRSKQWLRFSKAKDLAK